MRFGLIRLYAALMLFCSPAIATVAWAAPNASESAAKASPAKPAKAPAKKKKPVRSQYKAPIYAAVIVDASTGQVLSEVNANTKGYPASLTKMMTLYLLFEALDRGDARMDSPMPVSARAAAAAPSKLGLTRKSKLTVEQAIGALITKSANDVAVVTAEFLGGTEPQFAEKMTARAREMGMTQTTFKNASGLPNPQQFSTAHDMAILARRLIHDFPQHYAYFSRMEYVYAGQTIRTHNRLLEFYEGADGIKTGFTSASGFNLVGSATRNGYRVIGVIFGGTSARARDRKLAGLMDQGFAVLSGAPTTAIAANGNTLPAADRIGTQIALSESSEGVTEQGDRDEPFMPVTRSGSTIETTSIAPLPSQPGTAMASLSPRTSPRAPVAKMDDFADAYGIQVGAFSTRARAEGQAQAAAGALKRTFAGAAPVVMGVKVKGRLVYRARVMGLNGADLLKACSLVPAKNKAGTCQAIRPS